ncbi:acetyltransferase [Colletotrichum salicis]|uniref:Acetyltransferase n=1 Tax=Colletotrichum salicis TaxID=1209931 RepID=A0A135UM66_9PEZI|nr:acetyltransferase [Colletotrichum salicis]
MQIATNAVLDSTAMKPVAVVTMLFLPPTFVATVFSMSMFNWQVSTSSDSTGGGGKPTVVPQFWIYWAVSLPLTVAIVIGWRVWWHFQKSYYEIKFWRSEKENVVFEDKRHENAHGPRRRRTMTGIYPSALQHRQLPDTYTLNMNSISAEMRNLRWTRDSYLISTDASLISVAQLNAAFASEAVYWTKAIPEPILKEMLQNSLCFGLYDTNTSRQEPSGGGGGTAQDNAAESEEYHRLVGFARLVTDFVSFAYTTDVWVDPTMQGNGLGRWLVGCVQETLEPMPYLRKSILATDSWDKSVPFYEKMMKMSVIGGQPGGQAIMQMKGKGAPGYTEKTS